MKRMRHSGRPFLVILPTYNERANIATMVTDVLAAAPDVDVLVIDDSSPDGTAGIIRDMMASSERLSLLQRPAKLGLGSAYILGFERAISGEYRGVFTMDADHSHDPSAMRAMSAALARADLVIGSRYTRGGRTDQPLVRKINSSAANILARAMLDLNIRDCTSGYRLYSVDILRRLPLEDLRSRGYSMLVELLCKVVDAGGRVLEVPIAFVDRNAGESKIGMHEVWESLRTIARLRRGRFGSLRTKFANLVYRAVVRRRV